MFSVRPLSFEALQPFWLHMKPLFQLLLHAYHAAPFQATLKKKSQHNLSIYL
jgi:hypothetical protein